MTRKPVLVLVAITLLLSMALTRPGSDVPIQANESEIQAYATTGDDWPMFGGTPQRNLVNSREKNLPGTWNIQEGKRQNVKWTAKLGSRAYGCPVIAGGKIFLGTNNEAPRNPAILGDKGVMMCFRESDGAFLWQAIHDKLPSGLVNDWPREGIPSMPVVEGKRLYYVSNRCELICADTEGFLDGSNDGVRDEAHQGPADADIIWRLDMMKDLRVYPHNLALCSPLLAQDLVFVVTSNGVGEDHLRIPSPGAPSFLAVNKTNGKVVWQDNSPTRQLLTLSAQDQKDVAVLKRMRDRGEVVLHGQWSNPAYANVRGREQVIFPGGDGWLRAFEPESGKLIWKFDCNPKSAKRLIGGRDTRNEFIATPVVHDDRLYIGVGQDPEHSEGVGHLWCIDLDRAVALGSLNKGHDVSPIDDQFEANAPSNRSTALAWHYGGAVPANELHALRQAWLARMYPWAGGMILAAVSNRLLALVTLDEQPRDESRDFVFGRTLSNCAIHDGLVYVAELGGYLHCLDANTGEKYWVHDLKSAVWGSAYVADDKVYLGTEDGDLFVFATGKNKRWLATIEMNHGIKGTPVAAKGVLYVVTEVSLFALQQKY